MLRFSLPSRSLFLDDADMCMMFEVLGHNLLKPIIQTNYKGLSVNCLIRQMGLLPPPSLPRIIHYYTSWIEKAPPGWGEKELWAALKSSESM